MELIDRVTAKRKERDELYEELRKAPIDLDEIFNAMVTTLRDNYIGFNAKRLYFTANEYRTYILSHHRYNKLTLQMLVRALHQFTADMHDRHLVFRCEDWVDYKNVRADFRVRAYEDALYVSSADEGCGLAPGDKIVAVQSMTPEAVRRLTRHNCFYSRDKERELWGGYLRMADNVTVEREDGSEEKISLRHSAEWEESYAAEFKLLGSAAYLRLEHLDYDVVSELIEESLPEIAGAEKLIIDLRRNIGGDADAAYALLPYVVDREYKLSELINDEGRYTNFTAANCELRYKLLSDFRETLTDSEYTAEVDRLLRLYTENYGKGIVFVPPEPMEELVIKPAASAPKSVLVLTDTFCENEGESFVSMLKRAGAKVKLIGRPTMGTLDYFDNITVKLNEHMSLSYPISETKAAHDGCGIAEKGIGVDEYIPWTPAEIKTDIILKRALEC